MSQATKRRQNGLFTVFRTVRGLWKDAAWIANGSIKLPQKCQKKKKLQSQFLGQTRERELHTRILNQMQQPLLLFIYTVCVYKDIYIYIDTHIASKYEEWHWLGHKQAACWLPEIKRRFDLIRRALQQWEDGGNSLALRVLGPWVSYGSHSINDSILIWTARWNAA